jgi:PRTRC genetic system ThiF family protein
MRDIEMRIEHTLSERIRARRAGEVLAVGAGGTGSAVLMGLPYLHQAMRVWGHPYGLHVTLMDPDVVSGTNCVRQPFAISDIGQHKATVLVNRINLFWGLNWSAVAKPFSERTLRGNDISTPDLLIGCVDTRAARRSIDEVLSGQETTYWLDLGNNAASGQYVLGQPLNRANRRKAERLRTVSELYPEIVDAATGEDDLPSCSAREALERQEPFINQSLAASALAMLSRLFRYGKLGHHGGFFNAQTGRMSALPIDPPMRAKARRRNRRVSSGRVHPIERSKLRS